LLHDDDVAAVFAATDVDAAAASAMLLLPLLLPLLQLLLLPLLQLLRSFQLIGFWSLKEMQPCLGQTVAVFLASIRRLTNNINAAASPCLHVSVVVSLFVMLCAICMRTL
jgi:hypothetical protein